MKYVGFKQCSKLSFVILFYAWAHFSALPSGTTDMTAPSVKTEIGIQMEDSEHLLVENIVKIKVNKVRDGIAMIGHLQKMSECLG